MTSRDLAKRIHENFDKSGDVVESLVLKAQPSSAALSLQLQKIVHDLRESGFSVLRNVISSEKVRRCRDVLHSHLQKMGRNEFEGRLTQRVYALPVKTREFDELICHPTIVSVLDELLQPNYLLSAAQAICIHPEESAQPLHYDDQFCLVPRPRQAFGVATIWPLTAFTEETGATVVIPQSHLWGDRLPARSEAVAVEMSAGDVVLFVSTLWHGGGANVSNEVREAVTFQYCEPYMRPQENYLLGMNADTIRDMPHRIARLCGMSIHPPFIGHYDGQAPEKSPQFQTKL